MKELLKVTEGIKFCGDKTKNKHNFKTRILELLIESQECYENFELILKNKNRCHEFQTVILDGKNFYTAIEMNTLEKRIFIYDDFNNKHYVKNTKNFIKEFEHFVDKFKIKTSDNKGSIYLVTDGKYTKIGATSYNVKKRLNELQTGNAKELKIIYEYKVKNKFSTEKMLHDMFLDKKILGEWYYLNFEDIQIIMSNKFNVEQNKCILDKDLIEILDNDIRVLESIHSTYISKVYKRYFNNYKNKLKIKEYKMNSKERFYIKQILANANNEEFIYNLLKIK